MTATLLERMEFFGMIVREGDCSASTLAVAFALLFRFYNAETGRCDPGQTRLARDAGIHPATVKKAADALEDGGWFRIAVHGGTMTRNGATNSYAPCLERVANSLGVASSLPVAKQAAGRVASSLPRTSNSIDEPVRESAEPARPQAQVFTLTPIEGGKAKKAGKSAARDKALYHAAHGCTTDNYQPGSSMAEWAARECPLVPDPIGPRTVEKIKDAWRNLDPKKKPILDFDATYRTYLRKRQEWAEADLAKAQPEAAPQPPRRHMMAGTPEAKRAYD